MKTIGLKLYSELPIGYPDAMTDPTSDGRTELVCDLLAGQFLRYFVEWFRDGEDGFRGIYRTLDVHDGVVFIHTEWLPPVDCPKWEYAWASIMANLRALNLALVEIGGQTIVMQAAASKYTPCENECPAGGHHRNSMPEVCPDCSIEPRTVCVDCGALVKSGEDHGLHYPHCATVRPS